MQLHHRLDEKYENARKVTYILLLVCRKVLKVDRRVGILILGIQWEHRRRKHLIARVRRLHAVTTPSEGYVSTGQHAI